MNASAAKQQLHDVLGLKRELSHHDWEDIVLHVRSIVLNMKRHEENRLKIRPLLDSLKTHRMVGWERRKIIIDIAEILLND